MGCIPIKGLSIALIVFLLVAVPSSRAPYLNPPATLQESDLVGTWEAHYIWGGVDRLILREDGTFKQEFWCRSQDYFWESPWGPWYLERFPDGRVRLHLEGGRYYLYDIDIAEREGFVPREALLPPLEEPWPHGFWDPVAEEFVNMPHKLVLNVRSDNGELVLFHMYYGSQGGVALGHWEEFRRVEDR